MKRSKGLAFLGLAPLVLAALTLPGALKAQGTFVYTNNDVLGPNSVSSFSVGSNGALTPVAGSPFLTGGNGNGPSGALGATSRIAVTTIPGDFLYATNDSSNTISGFSIDSATGILAPISGSPFATALPSCPTCGAQGIALAVTPGGQFLYAGNGALSGISAFRIESNGALTLVPGSPFPAGEPVNMKVTPDRKFLAVSSGVFGLAMFSVASNGALTPVPGSPFLLSGSLPEGLDVNCASNLVFVLTGTFGQGPRVDVLNIASNGVSTPIAGSPFTFSGSFSLANVLSPDGQHLFVSNEASSTITSLNAASGGSLTEVTGSPFSTSPLFPLTMATNQAGTLLYVAALFTGSDIIAFNIDSKSTLSPVSGSPFSTGVSGSSVPSVAVFPPKSCFPAPTVTGISPTSAIAGGPAFILTVNGTTFVSGSVVNFKGNALATTFVSATQLAAAVPASDIAIVGGFNVTVTNPSGGGTSNAVSFTVVTPEQATQTIVNSVNALFSQGVLNGGQDNSLVVKLQHAINVMNAGKNDAAIRRLDSFINEVNDLLSSGVLSPSQAASLVGAAQRVIAAL